MSEGLRALGVIVLCGGFSAFMLWQIWQGLKSGKMPHSESRSMADRRQQPAFFWFLFFVFCAFAVAALYAVCLVLRDML